MLRSLLCIKKYRNIGWLLTIGNIYKEKLSTKTCSKVSGRFFVRRIYPLNSFNKCILICAFLTVDSQGATGVSPIDQYSTGGGEGEEFLHGTCEKLERWMDRTGALPKLAK